MRGIGRSRKSTNRRVPRSRGLAPHPRGPRAISPGEARRLYRAGKRSGDAERASLCFGNWPNPAMFSICSKAPLVRPAKNRLTRSPCQLPSQLLPCSIGCFLRKSSEPANFSEGKKSAKLLNRDLAEFGRNLRERERLLLTSVYLFFSFFSLFIFSFSFSWRFDPLSNDAIFPSVFLSGN